MSEVRWETLTRRQMEVLRYVTDFRAARGEPPVLREIGAAFGVSIPGARKYLQALARKGYVTVARYAHRGVKPARSRREWKVRRAWEGEFDRKIGARLAEESDLARVCDLVRDQLRPWLGADRADLLLYDPHRRELRSPSFYGVSPAGDATGKEPPAADALADRALKRRRPAVEAGIPDGTRNSVAVPILDRDRRLGVLRLETPGGAAGGDGLMARAAMAAAALAPALERATLNAELQRRIRMQAALARLIRTVNSVRDLRQILHDVYGIVCGLVDAPAFLITVSDDAGRWWQLLEMDHAGDETCENFTRRKVVIGRNEAIQAIRVRPYWIRHRTPEMVRVLEEGGRVVSEWGSGPVGLKHRRSASILYVPLRSEERVIGYLSAQSYRFNAYTLQDAEDLNLIGEYVGVAVQNAWREQTAGRRAASERARRERLARLPAELSGIADQDAREMRRSVAALAEELAALRPAPGPARSGEGRPGADPSGGSP